MRNISAGRLQLWLMLVLTFTTGINDAVGYLGLGKVFTGNMTGNVVVLGMALVGGAGLPPVLGPALALIAFMAGAALSGRALRRGTRTWHGRTAALFAFVAAILLGLATMLLGSLFESRVQPAPGFPDRQGQARHHAGTSRPRARRSPTRDARAAPREAQRVQRRSHEQRRIAGVDLRQGRADAG